MISNAKVGRKKLATITGVRDSTLKYYSEQGLLPYDQAGAGLARRYELQTAIERLKDIQSLQTVGLNIEQIKTKLIAGHA